MTARLKGRRLAAERAISSTTSWAGRQPSMTGLVLVGSYARGRPTMASDVDLLVLTSRPELYLARQSWIEDLLPQAILIRTSTWGPVTERRLRLRNGLHIELGFASPEWAAVPLDAGTARVLSDGCRVLYDPDHRLRAALACLAR